MFIVGVEEKEKGERNISYRRGKRDRKFLHVYLNGLFVLAFQNTVGA